MELKAGQSLVTVSSDGIHTLYVWRQGRNPSCVLIFDPTHTSLFCPGTTASYRRGIDLSVVPNELPPLPFTLPSTLPLVAKRSEPSPFDKILHLLVGAKKAFILYTRATMQQNPPYVDGYENDGRYWVGAPSSPSFDVKVKGTRVAGSVRIPEELVQTTTNMLAIGSKKDPVVHTMNRFKLIALQAQPLAASRFKLESYLADGATVENLQEVIRYHPGKGSLDDQFQNDGTEAGSAPVSPSGASFVGVLLSLVGFGE